MNGRKIIYEERLTRSAEKALANKKKRCVDSAWENDCNIKVKRRPGWRPFFLGKVWEDNWGKWAILTMQASRACSWVTPQ
jgi:hypothetical protein